MHIIGKYALYFFFYSFIGWVLESIVCSIFAHKWINRGFLTGPLCPIYGAGVLTMLICLTPIQNAPLAVDWFNSPFSFAPLLVALGAMFACDALEFITSLTMEKLFHARWWDYTNKFCNLQGRICLGHTMFWGISGIAVIYVVNPLTEKLFDLVPANFQRGILAAVLVIFALDWLRSFKSAANIRSLMDKINALRGKMTAWVIPEKVSGAQVTADVREAEDFVHKQTADLEGWSTGAHLKNRAKTAAQKIRRHAAQIFYGYPAMLKLAHNALDELGLLLSEVGKRLFESNDSEMY
ncbi:MAG: putative ABC transporter permease [Oscillospiraceae bacterium]|jgi:uncharacterized membrane protein|nr:putative ABC transporter permease [Oscillospiraceae bacterium]